MTAAVCALVYGTVIGAGGVLAYVRIRSLPSLIGGVVIGGLADLGGAMLLVGLPSGRGIALMATILATLFFGWSVSRAILTEGGVARPAGLATFSILAAVVLLWSG